MIHIKPNLNRNRIQLILIAVSIILFTWLCLLKRVDELVCYTYHANRLGLNDKNPDSFFVELDPYLTERISKGSTRQNVFRELNKISPIHISSKRELWDGTVEETVTLFLCINPLNNIPVDVYFEKDSLFRSIYIESDYP
jgi:hypothetical protein